ncbi:GNAT family N-acetyltransferase [Leptospira kanakyensis]|uniref:GNAT family N-acetyltransferase n=1 Tax=Leptospira kanakyensis TaxID=2484968 RepID=UPI00223DCAEA|nr:GNAT family protein [Leptospira kanakyensis]MCW7481191.1 GNAT family N-acetyltransferase [Leptospira kanakyensis]
MYRLETDRLVLREWKQEDIHDLIEGLNHLEVSKWLAFVPFPYTEEDAKTWIRYNIDNDKKDDKRNSYHFAIELKENKKVIGGVSLDKINQFQGTASGGIWINANYQKLGLGTEAFGKRIEFAFQELKLRRLENGYFDGNPSSLKMQKKFGYKIEGKRRKAFICMATNEIMDENITGLLKEEWIKG